MVAAKLENLEHGQRADLARDANLHVLKRAEAASLLNVSPRSVAIATRTRRRVLETAKDGYIERKRNQEIMEGEIKYWRWE